MNIKIKTILITLVLGCFLISGTQAAQGRKLPIGAYIKSAKIEILSGEFGRYETAQALLDSLFMNYGPHAEGLHLMEQMMVDYIEKTPSLNDKIPYVEKLVAYNDSLHACCENQKIKKKYRDGCDEYIELSDSLKVKYWRQFYNDGINQMKIVEERQEQLKGETDSIYIQALNEEIKANADSAITNINISLSIDDSDYRGYIGVGSVYEKLKDYEKAIEWLNKGLEKIDNRTMLLNNIAYDYIMMNDYCKAIPYFKEHIGLVPTDTSTMTNLAICYNNCGFYDSALAVNHQILTVAPNNAEALSQIGRFFNQMVRNASDSSSYFQKEGANEAKAKEFNQLRNDYYDSSIVYFKRVTEITPDDVLAQEQYGTICALRENYSEASAAFKKLTELKPEHIEYWRYLGDCELKNKNYAEAAKAYEQVVAANDSDLLTWESLSALYKELGEKAKAKDADAKIKSLK